MEKYYSRPEIYVNVEDGTRTVVMGHSRRPTYHAHRAGKGTSSAFSPMPLSDTTCITDFHTRDSISSPSTLQATESPSSVVPSSHPPGLAGNPNNEKRRPLPRVPEREQVPQQQLHAPPSVFSNAESRQSDEHVDRIANIIMERMANRLGTMVQEENAPPPQYE